MGSKQNWINPCLLTLCWPSGTHLRVTLEPVPLEMRKTACTCSVWDRTWWILLHFWVLLIVNHEVPDQTSAFSPCKLYWTAAACWICPLFSPGGKQMLSLEIPEQNCVSSRQGSLGYYKYKACFMFVISVRRWRWGRRNPSGVMVVSRWC